ncbi:MAG TPA: tol-pal system protein YbgF [Thermoanaerobaculia bacterium]|nr:tol-pal system protein YbgF [Thermoanaerobaculia bacterium]
MRRGALSIVLVSLLTGGCASTGDVERLRNQVSELQEELANIRRTASSKEEVQTVSERIVSQTEMLLRSNATLVAKVNQMDERIQSAQGAVEQVSYRMDQLAQQMTQAQRDIEAQRGVQVPPPAATAPAASPAMPAVTEVTMSTRAGTTTAPAANPIDMYNSAYRDYQLSNYDLAIAGFRDFIEDNPNSDLADNAAYWIGESLFSQKKFRDAIEQFDSVVTRYPRSDKVPGALLKKGYAYINLNERAQGIVQLQYVVHEHPTSQEASLARQRLRALGVETR